MASAFPAIQLNSESYVSRIRRVVKNFLALGSRVNCKLTKSLGVPDHLGPREGESGDGPVDG